MDGWDRSARGHRGDLGPRHRLWAQLCCSSHLCKPGSPKAKGWLWIDSLAFEEREVVTMAAAGREEAGDVPWAVPEIPEKLCSGVVRKHEVTNGPVLVRPPSCALTCLWRQNTKIRFVYKNEWRGGRAVRGGQSWHSLELSCSPRQGCRAVLGCRASFHRCLCSTTGSGVTEPQHCLWDLQKPEAATVPFLLSACHSSGQASS